MGGIDSYTKLMLHMDGADGSITFTDNSLTPKTVIPSGNAQIDTAQSVFGGASGLFDGSGDYLRITTGEEFNFGTGDFTIDLWFRVVNYSSSRTLLSKFISWVANFDFHLYIVITTGKLTFVAGDGAAIYMQSNSAVPTGTFTHCAIVRSSGTTKMYIDGVAQTSTHSGSVTIPNDKTILSIGVDSTNFDAFYGHIDEIRVSKGIARWISDFTPPTSAYNNYVSDLSLGDFNKTFSLELTKDIIELIRSLSLNDFDSDFSIGLTKELLEAIKTISVSNVDEYTKLLIHGDGEEGSQLFYDSSELHEISVVGTLPQVSSTSKFGTGSIQFSLPVYTTGNYLTVPNSQDWNFYSDNWTIDFQIYFEPNPLITYHGILHHFDPVDEWGMELRLDQQFSTNNYRILFYLSDENWDDVIYFRTNYIELLPQTWYHIALVVENNIPMIFVNGQSQLLAYSDYLLLPVPTILNDLFIGVSNLISSNKKIDELRISKGIARWTSNFTPPTESYGTNGDINLTMSIDLVQDLQGILTRSLGDFDIYSSFDLLKTLEKILVLGDFNLNQTWYLKRIQSVVSSLILKHHLLAGNSLILKNNLNVINEVKSSLILKYDIPPLTEINSNLTLINSLIGSVEGNLQILNRLTEPVIGNLTLRNKLTDKNEVEGTLTLKNNIDPQTTPPTYTDPEQDQANFESGLTDPESPNYNPQLASLTYFYFTEEHTG